MDRILNEQKLRSIYAEKLGVDLTFKKVVEEKKPINKKLDIGNFNEKELNLYNKIRVDIKDSLGKEYTVRLHGVEEERLSKFLYNVLTKTVPDFSKKDSNTVLGKVIYEQLGIVGIYDNEDYYVFDFMVEDVPKLYKDINRNKQKMLKIVLEESSSVLSDKIHNLDLRNEKGRLQLYLNKAVKNKPNNLVKAMGNILYTGVLKDEKYNKGVLCYLGDDALGNPIVDNIAVCTSIVGGSGSGKTYLLDNILKSVEFLNNTNDYEIIYKSLKGETHKIGDYEEVLTEVDNIIDYIDNVSNIMNRENISLEDLMERDNESYKYKILVIDEITLFLSLIETESTDLLDNVRNKLRLISNAHIWGVGLVVAGQRSIDRSIPKPVLLNSFIRIYLGNHVENDFYVMFGNKNHPYKLSDLGYSKEGYSKFALFSNLNKINNEDLVYLF